MLMICIDITDNIVLEMDLMQDAIIALLLGILPNVPGFLLTDKSDCHQTAFPMDIDLYNYAWFVGFFVSGILYMLLMRSNYKTEYVDQILVH